MADTAVPAFIDRLEDTKRLQNVMENARNKGRDDVYWAAFRRLCEVEGKSFSDPLEQDFYKVLAAYEQLLSEKNGRNTAASRTRQKLARHSIEKCLEDWAMSKAPTPGFTLLIEKGMPDLTAEALVIKYSDRFSPEVIEAAKKRLGHR